MAYSRGHTDLHSGAFVLRFVLNFNKLLKLEVLTDLVDLHASGRAAQSIYNADV